MVDYVRNRVNQEVVEIDGVEVGVPVNVQDQFALLSGYDSMEDPFCPLHVEPEPEDPVDPEDPLNPDDPAVPPTDEPTAPPADEPDPGATDEPADPTTPPSTEEPVPTDDPEPAPSDETDTEDGFTWPWDGWFPGYNQ